MMQSLDEKEWKRIPINSVFVIGHGFYNKKPPMSSEGEVPFIGASGINNGVTGFCTMQAVEDNSKVGYGPNEPIERKLFDKGSICVVNNGSAIGYSYYQPKQFTCTHDVNPLTLRDHEMNEDEALFLSQMIRKQGVCFIYARKWRPSRMVRSQFLLPVDDDGKPDYGYMAQYASEMRGVCSCGIGTMSLGSSHSWNTRISRHWTRRSGKSFGLVSYLKSVVQKPETRTITTWGTYRLLRQEQ